MARGTNIRFWIAAGGTHLGQETDRTNTNSDTRSNFIIWKTVNLIWPAIAAFWAAASWVTSPWAWGTPAWHFFVNV